MRKIRDLVKNKIDENEAKEIASNMATYLENSCKKKDLLSEDFVDITNLFLFEHGLLLNTGLKDYVLVDFIKNNSYLVNGINLPKSIFDSSILELGIEDDLSLSNFNLNKYFDIYKEFVAINAISKSNPYLCNLIVKEMDAKTFDRKFFRVLSFYTAVYCLHLRIDIEREKNEFRKNELNEKLDYMFEVYDDFTQINPKWLIRD